MVSIAYQIDSSTSQGLSAASPTESMREATYTLPSGFQAIMKQSTLCAKGNGTYLSAQNLTVVYGDPEKQTAFHDCMKNAPVPVDYGKSNSHTSRAVALSVQQLLKKGHLPSDTDLILATSDVLISDMLSDVSDLSLLGGAFKMTADSSKEFPITAPGAQSKIVVHIVYISNTAQVNSITLTNPDGYSLKFINPKMVLPGSRRGN